MSKYINADELKVTLLNLADGTKEWGEGVQIGFNSCINALDVMPSADVVEVKHGKWEEDSGNIACSECHTIWLYRRTDFCPNCGADMRERKETVGNTIDVNTIITGDTKNDLVAVVRCKDCVFSNAEYTHCCLLDTCIIENDYCSWGERKETNE